MKTAVVELDAVGRGCHGHRSLLMVGWMLATLQDVAGICGASAGPCGTIAGPCWTLRDIAGPCGTMLDHLRGTRGMIGRSRMTDRCTIQKKWAPFWKLGGNAHHYRFFLRVLASLRDNGQTVRRCVRLFKTVGLGYF